MAHNLHDKKGWYLVGLDGHIGLHFPPLIASTFFWEVTGAHPFLMGSNFQANVQFNGGTPSVVDQHNPKFLWPHLPFAPDPLNMLFPLDVVFGDHKTWLPRLQVLINGTPAAPTVFPGSLSMNVNCWAFGHIPTNLVHQPGTVQTNPTAADYEFGAIRWAVDFAIEVILFFATGGFKGTAFTKDGIEDVAQKLEAKLTQKATDKLASTATADEIREQTQKEVKAYVRSKFTSKVFTYPKKGDDGYVKLGASIGKTGYGGATGAIGWDPGQAAAHGITGQGKGATVGFDPIKGTKGIVSKFVPAVGPLYDGTQIG
jgi:hypothetical protein